MSRTTTNHLAARAQATPSDDAMRVFEAPLYTHPYPLAGCGAACMDTRDVDLDDAFGDFQAED